MVVGVEVPVSVDFKEVCGPDDVVDADVVDSGWTVNVIIYLSIERDFTMNCYHYE